MVCLTFFAPHSDLIKVQGSSSLVVVDLDNDKPSCKLSAGGQGNYIPRPGRAFVAGEEVSSHELLLPRDGKLIRQPNLNVPEPVTTAVVPVVDDNLLHRDREPKVQSQPGRLLSMGVTHASLTANYLSVNAPLG